jgi:dsDNA-binding SOS-regulon protein
MAVETIYRSTYKPSEVFMKKSEADQYDSMLEAAEGLAAIVRHVLPHVSEEDAEKVGIYMAERRASLAAALKKDSGSIMAMLKDEGKALSSVVPLANAS